MAIADRMKLLGAWKRFSEGHPRFAAFLGAVKREGLSEGTIIEVRVTTPEGKDLVSNLRLSAEDMELYRSLTEMGKD